MNIDMLIGEVFLRSPLWDQKDKNHHNRFILDKLSQNSDKTKYL